MNNECQRNKNATKKFSSQKAGWNNQSNTHCKQKLTLIFS